MKKSIRNAIIFFTGVVFMVGCKSTNVDSGSSKIFGDWIATEVVSEGSSAQIPNGTVATISFAENEAFATGFSGVNYYSAEAKIGKDTISFGSPMITMMAGAQADMDFETMYLSCLNVCKNFTASDNALKIFYDDKNYVSFEKLSIKNKEWKLLSFNSGDSIETIADGLEKPTLVLNNENDISGSTGVNSLMGKYALNEKNRSVSFTEIGITRMAPRNAAAGALEQQYTALLEKVCVYRVSGNTLTFIDENEITLLVFSK